MAKTNVKYVKKVFGVNHEEKTVTCVLTYEIDTRSIPGINILTNLPEYNDFINCLVYQVGVKYNDGVLQFKVQDIAFCASDDEFNETLGKQLALTRAQKLAFRNSKYFYYDIARMFKNYYEKFNTLEWNCRQCEINCHEHEFEITNSVR